MVYFTREVPDGVLTKDRDSLEQIIWVPTYCTHMYYTNTEVMDYFIYLLLVLITKSKFSKIYC